MRTAAATEMVYRLTLGLAPQVVIAAITSVAQLLGL